MAIPHFLAMMSPEAARSQQVGVVVVVLLAVLFAYRTARRGEAKGVRRTAGFRLPLIGFACGPALGAVLAGVFFAFIGVHPLDVGYELSALLGIGLIAGIIAAAALGLPALLSHGPRKPPGDPDDWEL